MNAEYIISVAHSTDALKLTEYSLLKTNTQDDNRATHQAHQPPSPIGISIAVIPRRSHNQLLCVVLQIMQVEFTAPYLRTVVNPRAYII